MQLKLLRCNICHAPFLFEISLDDHVKTMHQTPAVKAKELDHKARKQKPMKRKKSRRKSAKGRLDT